MSRSVCTNRSSIDLMSFENRPMIFLFRFGEVILATVCGGPHRKPASTEWVPRRVLRGIAAAPDKLDLAAQSIFAIEVARGEVERADADRLRGPGDPAGLCRGEVPPLAGDRGVLPEKSRLDE